MTEEEIIAKWPEKWFSQDVKTRIGEESGVVRRVK